MEGKPDRAQSRGTRDLVLGLDSIVCEYDTRERQGIIDPMGGVHGAPDLVIEILSPSTVSRDQVGKRKLYGKYCIREYWIVDPVARTIEVLSLGQSGLDAWRAFPTGSLLTSLLLPGLSISVEDVFAD